MGYVFSLDSVDPEFAGRALEAQWRRNEPLLRGPLDSDHTVLYAVPEGGSFGLVDPCVSVPELSRMTYGEHYEIHGEGTYESFAEYCDYEFGEPKEFDEAMDPNYVLEWCVGPYEMPSGRAFTAIEPYCDAIGPNVGISGHEVLLGQSGGDFMQAVWSEVHNPVPIELRDTPYPLGYVIGHEGPMPGSDYVGIEVSGPVGLSCLQHVLDRAGAGIRLELAPEGFDPFS